MGLIDFARCNRLSPPGPLGAGNPLEGRELKALLSGKLFVLGSGSRISVARTSRLRGSTLDPHGLR